MKKNVQVLPSFSEFGAGMSYQLGKIRFAIDGTNIFNTIGITEGDPRAGSPTGDGIIMARPIMGAAVRGSHYLGLLDRFRKQLSKLGIPIFRYK